MTPAELHTRCETLQQALIDLIAAVLDIESFDSDEPEMAHLHDVLAEAMRLVQNDVPPLAEVGEEDSKNTG